MAACRILNAKCRKTLKEAEEKKSAQVWCALCIGENMGKLQEFVITFDKNKVMYSPGDPITGTVTIKLVQPLQCKGKTANSAVITVFTFTHLVEDVAVAKQGSNGF